MTVHTISLRADDPRVTLTAWISDDEGLSVSPRPAMLVIPGGGYGGLAPREAEPIGRAFFAAGFQIFILRYSVGAAARFPRPLEDGARSIVHIRENAEAYHVDPARVFVVGFSAGGHLAAMLGTMWHLDCARVSPDMPEGLNRPTGMILAYAVLTAGEYAHKGSFHNLLGTETPAQRDLDFLSIENRVNEKTVPAFIWHTAADRTVPVQNALLMASALAAHDIPFALHIYPDGPHGMALGTEETRSRNPAYLDPCAARWVDDAVLWTRRVK